MYVEPSAKDLRISALEKQLHEAKKEIRRLKIKIKNPDWRPSSWSQLTVAQRRHLRLLAGLVCYIPLRKRDIKSFDSLVRHGLAIRGKEDLYVITASGQKMLKQGGYDAEGEAQR